MSFKEKWHRAVAEKNSILCVGVDPAEPGQRSNNITPSGLNKLDHCISVIEAVAPYSAAIKPNHQYIRDFSRMQIKTLNDKIHELGMVSIDDSKVADIGDTNDAAFYHSKAEGFDAITYAPFAGNLEGSIQAAKARDLGIITLTLMSNPEFLAMKHAQFEETPGYLFFAKKVAEFAGDAMVVGAPSEKNHITLNELKEIRQACPEGLVLVPGIGAQGGASEHIVQTFGRNAIVAVGRSIFYSDDPAKEAEAYQKLLMEQLDS